MTYIATIPPGSAEGEVNDMYQRQRGCGASVPDYARVFCYRPALMGAWAAMQKEIKAQCSHKIYCLVSMVAALEANGSFCAMVFARKLRKRYYSDAAIAAIIANTEHSPLSAAELAMVRLARKVVRDASSVEPLDMEQLREQGVSDAEIFDVVAIAAARCFFSKIPDALGVRPDASMNDLGKPLISLLTTGRSIDVQQYDNSLCDSPPGPACAAS